MWKLLIVLETVALLCSPVVGGLRPAMSVNQGGAQSPVATSVADPRYGFNAVFPPVPSCLSDVVLVIYVQFLGMLERLDDYRSMYGPFFADIEFYVDGTWCDPRSASDSKLYGYPCYGDVLNRSSIPEEVHVVDGNGGGWMMQRSFIDAVLRPRDDTPRGFLFVSDDALLNMGQLSRVVSTSGCDVIWRSALTACNDVESDGPKTKVFKRFLAEARAFYKVSDPAFRERLSENLGTPSTYCMGIQNDFLYMPAVFAERWAKVSNQMTDSGLVFTFAFYTAIFGIARMGDMVVLRSAYLKGSERADAVLRDAELRKNEEPYCWTGTRGNVSELLASHIIHPNKLLHSKQEWDFAETVNPPAVQVAVEFSRNQSSLAVESPNDFGAYDEEAVFPFWCDT
ncbi:unnamed protein product [Scytosiphon promiscuus]